VQQQCGRAGANSLTNVGGSAYLAPVTCDRFFSYDWFILFFHFFVWALVAFFLFSATVHTFRHGLVTLLAVAAVLLMFLTNTWYAEATRDIINTDEAEYNHEISAC
jgi:Ca2+/Na+ antiporter